MADYQQIADRVRAFVAGADQTRSASLADLAASYAQLCQETNDRLRRCVDYLRRGLRSEAIHLADAPPSVLDMVATLDIPQIAEWEQVCAAYELERPSRIIVDAAQELNEAYAQFEPLRPLLTAHRRLALERAPLHQRLSSIRALADADPGTSHWAEDQELFETARLRELRTVADAAIRSQEIGRIDGLAAELTEQKWRVAVPRDITESILQNSKRIHGVQVAAALRAGLPEMRSILQSGAIDKAKKLLSKWQKSIDRYAVSLPADAAATVEELRQFVSSHADLQSLQAAFAEKSATLRTLIDHQAPAETLTSHYRELQSVGLPIPEELEGSYRSLLGRLQRSSRFEERGIQLIVVTVAVAVVAGAAVAIWSYLHSLTH